jgi:hypothetical protein
LTVGPLNIGEYEITMKGDSRLVVLWLYKKGCFVHPFLFCGIIVS